MTWGFANRPATRSVYFARQHYGTLIKIGIANNIETRMRDLGCECLLEITLPTDEAERLERELHKTFAHLCHVGEWFWPDDELVSYIKRRRLEAA